MTQDSFPDQHYRAFEDRFRGSRALIRSRLLAYLQLIERADRSHPNARKALDLGCGRGEWLELIAEHGWQGVGVDINSGMAESARAAGIEPVLEDALTFLRRQEDQSFGLVTAFHLVEHVQTDYLLNLLSEIKRVLAPDGIVILETPNPENLTVASWGFHMDPTHKRPIPPRLLQFYAEMAGFEKASIFRLNGEPTPGEMDALGEAVSMLFRAAPDYAVIATQASASTVAGIVREFSNNNRQTSSDDLRPFFEAARRRHENDKRLLEIVESLQSENSGLAQTLDNLSKDIQAKLTALNEQNLRMEGELRKLRESVDNDFVRRTCRFVRKFLHF